MAAKKHYGSGQRVLDESKMNAAMDAINHWTRVANGLPVSSPEREVVEARIGRETVRWLELVERLESGCDSG